MSLSVGKMADRTWVAQWLRANTVVYGYKHTSQGSRSPTARWFGTSPPTSVTWRATCCSITRVASSSSARCRVGAVGLEPDLELLYVGAMFHDVGLTQRYRESTARFEVDGANAARDFLLARGADEHTVRKVWLSIALHTTPGIPEFLDPEIALVTAGVETDVLGIGARRLVRRRACCGRRLLTLGPTSSAASSRRSTTATSIARTAHSATSTPTCWRISIRRSSARISSRSSSATNGRSDGHQLSRLLRRSASKRRNKRHSR